MTALPGRLVWLDNLRWTMILLVISMHAADTYSPLGNWYYTDRVPLSMGTLLAFAAWQTYLQSFFMGLLFFVAGCFVPASLARKGPARFIRDRASRLGLPLLFYMFVLGPVTEYFFAHSWNSTGPTSFAQEWVKHIRNGQFLQENGPLWFCLALLIFSVAHTAVSSSRQRPANQSYSKSTPGNGPLAAFALVMAAGTFLLRAGRPESILNLPVRDFAQYVLLFGAGIAAAQRGWLGTLPYALGIRWIACALTVGFAAWLLLLIAGGALRGNGAAFSGGWHWQSAGFAVWESFTCVALSAGLLVLYRDRWNAQPRWAKFLSDNAFAVYVFHPPVVIAGARMLHLVDWHPLLKFGLLTVFAAALTYLLCAAVFRRLPLLRRIL